MAGEGTGSVLGLSSGTDLVSLGQIPGELSHETVVPECAMAYGHSSEQLWAGGMNINHQGHHGEQGDGEHTLARRD